MPLIYIPQRNEESTTPEPVSLAALFGNDHPLEIEIGCGKGKFLLGLAQERPETNFLGVDRAAKWMKIGEGRGEKRGVQNLKFIKAEMKEFLEALPPLCARGFHIYFPDPWPKRRHRGRRLLDAGFFRTLDRYLLPGGFIHVATDDADYYRQIRAGAADCGVVWASFRESINERLMHPHLKTNYELKFEAAGRPLHYLELRKAGGA